MTKRHSINKYFLKMYHGLGTVLTPGKQIKKKYTPVSVLQKPNDIQDDDLIYI